VDEYALALYESVTAAVPGWVERSVFASFARMDEEPPPGVVAEATAAGRRAQVEVQSELGALLEADIDEQSTTPLAIVRHAARHATAVLAEARVPPPQRDAVQQRLFPDDTYDLAPATLGDVDASLTEPALIWGAHKAMAHLQRHGAP
jgi:hypothetical protein